MLATLITAGRSSALNGSGLSESRESARGGAVAVIDADGAGDPGQQSGDDGIESASEVPSAGLMVSAEPQTEFGGLGFSQSAPLSKVMLTVEYETPLHSRLPPLRASQPSVTPRLC